MEACGNVKLDRDVKSLFAIASDHHTGLLVAHKLCVGLYCTLEVYTYRKWSCNIHTGERWLIDVTLLTPSLPSRRMYSYILMTELGAAK